MISWCIEQKQKNGRLLSNPLGFLFGNESCKTVIIYNSKLYWYKILRYFFYCNILQLIFWISLQKKDGRDLTGICYNEVECLLKGGILSGYCSGGPPVLKGVCCVFIINANNCDTSKVIDSIYCKWHTILITLHLS